MALRVASRRVAGAACGRVSLSLHRAAAAPKPHPPPHNPPKTPASRLGLRRSSCASTSTAERLARWAAAHDGKEQEDEEAEPEIETDAFGVFDAARAPSGTASDGGAVGGGWGVGEGVGGGGGAVAARDNPFVGRAATETRRPVQPPRSVLDAVSALMEGRNLVATAEEAGRVRAAADARERAALKSVEASKRMPGVQHGWAADVERPVLYGPRQTVAYAAHRCLPNWGAAVNVMDTVAKAMPAFRPKSMLDFGSGPGTAVLAARFVWPDTLFDVVTVEQSRSMMQVAEHMLADFPYVMYRRSLAEVARFHKHKTYDVVNASYVLSELPTEEEREKVIQSLWQYVNPGGVLLILDEGTRWGFHVVKTARDDLLDSHRALRWQDEFDLELGSDAEEAVLDEEETEIDRGLGIAVIAPCAHVQRCPMHAKSWCHFGQVTYGHPSMQPMRRRLRTGRMTLPRDISKFSYVALRRINEEQAKEHAPFRRVMPMSYYDEEKAVGEEVEPWASPVPEEMAGALPDDASSRFVGDGAARAFEWMQQHNAPSEVASSATGVPVNPNEVARRDRTESDHARSALDEAIANAVELGMPGAGTWSRIVRPPLRAGKHVTLDLCTPRGTMERRVPSKGKLKEHKGAYRAARKSGWGGEWPDWLSRKRTGLPHGKQRKMRRSETAPESIEHHAAASDDDGER